MDVKLRLEALLGCSVDLVLASALKERLRPGILAEAVERRADVLRHLCRQSDEKMKPLTGKLREH